MIQNIKKRTISAAFWGLLIVGIVFTIIGILQGNPFEDYQAAASL